MDEYSVSIVHRDSRREILEKSLNDYIFKDELENLMQKGLVKRANNVYNLTKEGYKYRDIISWGFFSDEVQKRDYEFYENMKK